MPNLSHRLSKASEESAQASRRITVAEGKIARTLIDMLREEESCDEASPSRACKNVTPPKTKPAKK